MTSVIRQEWKRRSSNIYTGAIVLTAVNLLALVMFYFENGHGSVLPFMPDWFTEELLIPIVLVLDTAGFYIGLMFDNAASMKDMLFKENGYLLKLVPVNSWKIIGGKYITGLLELLFFGVQCLLYLLMFGFIASDGAVASGDWYYLTTLEKWNVTLCVLAAIILLWLFVTALINMARTVTAVITKRWKVPKAVIYILMFLIVWLTLKWTFTPIFKVIENFDSPEFEASLQLQTPAEVFDFAVGTGWKANDLILVISGIYYAITCWLYDKFVEV